jgi:hypothetical protein
MTQRHLAVCVRRYRQAVEAYAQLELRLAELRQAVAGLPVQRSMRRRLEDVSVDLERIGGSISLILELAQDLQQEKRINSKLWEQAARAGLIVRYDVELE